MAHYGEFLRSIRRATTFRRRRRGTRQPLGDDPPRPEHVLRAGRRREAPRAAAWRLLALAWPAAVTTGLGLPIQAYYDSGRHVWAHVPASFFHLLWIALCLVFAARAFSTLDRPGIRLTATAINLAFPLWLVARAVV